MTTSYTSLLGLALPVTGELAGTWGDTVNNSITSLLDTAVAGTTTLSTDADVILTTTTGAANEARAAILLCTGSRAALRNITAPAQSKVYAVVNNTTGGYGVKIRGTGPTTGVTVANGKTAIVIWNGSDFVEVAPATATTASNLAGGAAGSVPYQTGSGATSMLALGTAAQVLQVNAGATAPEWVSSTGTGNVVRASSPTLTTPTLGVASATSINKVALTAPATGSTLTIADGKTLTASNTLTFTGTDSSSVAFGTGGTVAYTGNNLSVFASTTSSQLAGVISDETGSGSLVFGTSPTIATPTITTSATVPLVIGGTGTTSTLTLRSTSGVGATGADIIFQTGNNGATEDMRITNAGNVGIGRTPSYLLDVNGTARFNTTIGIGNTAPSASGAGISFPATQSASTDANTLDDYEEGTWTPVVEGTTAAGTATYSIQNGRYTKIGRMVQFECYVQWTAGTGTGNIRVGGLPFTSANASVFPEISISADNLGITAGNYLAAYINNSATTIAIIQQSTSGGAVVRSSVPYDAGAELLIAGTYTV